MTKIQLTYCGMRGEGGTVKEAKADAARKIEAVLEMDYEPRLLSYGGKTGLVWQTPSGVCSAYVGEDGKTSGVCFHGSNGTFDDACESMRLNLAQCGAEVWSDVVPAILGKSDKLRRDYVSWLGFQRAYQSAEGNDVAKHRWACEHGGEFVPHKT